jgi:hypothetical protein
MGTSKGWFVDNWTRMNAENADAEIIPSLLEAGVRGFFNDSFLIGRG